jgi:ribose-phosphate pyrophosphokinase
MSKPEFASKDRKAIRLFTGNAHPKLAADIVARLGLDLGDAKVSKFRDGEIQVEIGESVRGKDVYLIQSMCGDVNMSLMEPSTSNWTTKSKSMYGDVNTALMELLVMIDAAKRASANSITAVIPYFAYARQDRKVASRAPITAKLVADLISTAGAQRVITVDLHAGQIQGFFNTPVDNLYAAQELVNTFINCVKCSHDDIVVVSPDAGGAQRALYFSRLLRGVDTDLAVIVKERTKPGEVERMILVGEVRGKTAVLVDDIVDSAGTLAKAAEKLCKEHAAAIYACCTHPVLSGPAVKNIQDSPIKKLFVTDTIPLRPDAVACEKIEVTTVSHLLANGIKQIQTRGSISELFPTWSNKK